MADGDVEVVEVCSHIENIIDGKTGHETERLTILVLRPTDSSLSSHRQGSHERLPAGRHWFLSHLNLCYTWFVCFF